MTSSFQYPVDEQVDEHLSALTERIDELPTNRAQVEATVYAIGCLLSAQDAGTVRNVLDLVAKLLEEYRADQAQPKGRG